MAKKDTELPTDNNDERDSQSRIGFRKNKSIDEKIVVKLNLNRPWDLHIGNQTFVFAALEEKELSEKILKHPDWKQHEKYFIVRRQIK